MAEPGDSSEERPLDPTEKRLQTAREEGQYPQSRDLTTLLVLLVFGGFVLGLGSVLSRQLVQLVQNALTFNDPDNWSDRLQEWAQGPLLMTAVWIFALLLPIWVISILAPLALVKFQPVLAWKISADKLDPIIGLGRLLSVKTLLEVGKNIIKTVLIFGAIAIYLWGLYGHLNLLPSQDAHQAFAHTLNLLQTGFLYLMLPMVVVAVSDIALQFYDYKKRMRMSPEEMKKEFKESEGSPELKARLRQRQRQIASSRMMSALEKADVILVNPEHYAVALRYDASKMAAPVVVAKGLDELALRIQSVGKELGVPIARIPPLARLMHQRLKIGQPVPAQLFEAVAKVLAWAYEFKEKPWGNLALPELGTLPKLEDLQK